MSTVKRGPVAALGVALVIAEVFFYSVGGWLLVIAAGSVWGGVAYASIRAERRVWSGSGRGAGCSDPECFVSHEPGERRCRCRCRGASCGEGADQAGRGRRGRR